MNLQPTTRIGDLVLERPAAMRLFETLNIDYCCGGHRSMAEACTLAGQDPAAVILQVNALERVPAADSDPKRWLEGSLTELAGHIEATHHLFTRQELARVAPLMAKVAKVHADNHPELLSLEQVFQTIEADLVPHLEKEEQVLFPFIRAMEAPAGAEPACFASVASPVRAMQAEHEAVGDLLREVRILTRDFTPPADACGSFRSLYMGLEALEKDLHLHIYLESHLLFPRAVALEAAPVRA